MRLKPLLILLCCLIMHGAIAQRPFTAGNIVVYRMGDGTVDLTTMADLTVPVFLDEYTPSGVFVQSIAMPTTGQKLTIPVDAPPHGLLTLSSDGRYLVVPGYNLEPGSADYIGDKSIALVNYNSVLTSMTVVANPNFNFFYSATSDNGNNLWLGGEGAGVQFCHTGDISAITITGSKNRQVNISNGRLYASFGGAPPGIGIVGTGLPTTTGQTVAHLPGTPGNTFINQFAFADMDPNVAGEDVLYMADQTSAGGGLQKYSLVNGTWVSNGTIGTGGNGYTGLTIKVSANTVTLFATRIGSNTSTIRGGELVSLIDNSGYNGTMTGTPAVISSVVNRFGANNRASFRGIARVPQPAPYTPGNIVVYRMGNGTVDLTTMADLTVPVFLDEYTPSGVFVQSIAMPTTGQKLTIPVDAPPHGLLTLSSDGRYLVVPGYNLEPGSADYIGDKSIALVNYNSVLTSMTVVANPNFNFFYSATSDNGNNLWLGGEGAGVQFCHTGDISAITITGSKNRQVNISNGRLYASFGGAPPGIGIVGTGLPTTTGQTVAHLPGTPGNTFINQFAFADMDPNVAGEDVLYMADQTSAGGGLQKYSLVNGTWVSNGTIGTGGNGYTGLTIKVSANTVTLFATRIGSNTSTIRGGELVSLIDNSGYNGTMTGTPAVISSVVNRFGANNRASFRGVARVPLNCPSVTALQAINVTSNQATLTWTPVNGTNNFQYAVTNSITPPASGTATSASSVTVTGLSNGLTYYAHVRTVCSAITNSEWTTVQFVSSCKPPAVSLLNVSISAAGVATVKWNKVFGAVSYEYFISTSAIPPTSGTVLNDTTITVNNLNSVTPYYVHVRSNCGNAFSNWVSKPFTTGCFMPVVAVSLLPNHAGAKWNKINNAIKYEYALTYNAAKPLSGSYTVDTSYLMDALKDGSPYYFHVRSICTGGAVSDWTTVNFHIQGLQVYPNPVNETLYINLNGLGVSNSEISVFDATGRMVKKIKLSGSSTTIDTRTWAPGIYIVHYNDGQNKYAVRIMKY